MLRCNLSVLLAERNLKITQVSKDTGISRTTLTALINNRSQGIQFDTINTLCNYLKITPDKLMSYLPLEIEISDIDILGGEILKLDLNIIKNSNSTICPLTGLCGFIFEDSTELLTCDDFSNPSNKKYNLIISIFLIDSETNYEEYELIEVKRKNQILINAFNTLTIPFIEDIQNSITDKIVSMLKCPKGLNRVVFTWCDELTNSTNIK